jgi:hypothetical protein
MVKLTYTRATSIILSNEDYTNQGLKQDDMIKAIEKINGVWMVEKYPINGNIQVHIRSNNEQYIRDVFHDIRFVLDNMLIDLNFETALENYG